MADVTRERLDEMWQRNSRLKRFLMPEHFLPALLGWRTRDGVMCLPMMRNLPEDVEVVPTPAERETLNGLLARLRDGA